MSDFILSIDQGTTSTKAFILNRKGELVAGEPVSISQIYPQPGFVEHSPEEIYKSVLQAVVNVLKANPGAMSNISSVGITNQRETTIAFGKNSIRSAYNAIVWQCRRTSEMCRRPEIKNMEQYICSKTGLKIDPYFSATKMRWIMENVPGIMDEVKSGNILFSTVDGYLVYRLTDRKSFCSDYSNVSRTMLFDIEKLDYDEELLKLFGIPRECLADPKPSCSDFGEIKLNPDELLSLGFSNEDAYILTTLNGVHITAVAGDQAAALFGQNAIHEGDAKTTYGTGCFTLMNVGNKPVFSKNGLLTSPAWSLNGETVYALEGSIFQGGSVISWLKDEMGMINAPSDCDEICYSIPDNGGVYLVPAFTGLGAPYWKPDVRGILTGLTRGSGRAQIVRASVESIAYQVTELVNLMMDDTGIPAKQMKVDGGVCGSDFLMQFQSDLLGVKITRARSDEMTAMGVGLLSGLQTGYFESVRSIYCLYSASKTYEPNMSAYVVEKLMNGYKQAVRTALASNNL